MATRKPTIVNPNPVFTAQENSFINEDRATHSVAPVAHVPVVATVEKVKRRARPRNFSMFDDFYEDMVNFLDEFPNEGNKSSFIVRVVADYMEKKRTEKRRNQLPNN